MSTWITVGASRPSDRPRSETRPSSNTASPTTASRTSPPPSPSPPRVRSRTRSCPTCAGWPGSGSRTPSPRTTGSVAAWPSPRAAWWTRYSPGRRGPNTIPSPPSCRSTRRRDDPGAPQEVTLGLHRRARRLLGPLRVAAGPDPEGRARDLRGPPARARRPLPANSGPRGPEFARSRHGLRRVRCGPRPAEEPHALSGLRVRGRRRGRPLPGGARRKALGLPKDPARRRLFTREVRIERGPPPLRTQPAATTWQPPDRPRTPLRSRAPGVLAPRRAAGAPPRTDNRHPPGARVYDTPRPRRRPRRL